jgi:hypothetical protein
MLPPQTHRRLGSLSRAHIHITQEPWDIGDIGGDMKPAAALNISHAAPRGFDCWCAAAVQVRRKLLLVCAYLLCLLPDIINESLFPSTAAGVFTLCWWHEHRELLIIHASSHQLKSFTPNPHQNEDHKCMKFFDLLKHQINSIFNYSERNLMSMYIGNNNWYW